MVSGGPVEPRPFTYQYSYNPDIEAFEQIGIENFETNTVGSDAFANKYFIRNMTVFERESGNYITTLNRTFDNRLTAYIDAENNLTHLELYTGIPIDRLNQRGYAHAGFSAGMDIDLLLSTGKSVHLAADYTKVSPPGYLLLYNGTQEWETAYRYIKWYPEIRSVDVEAQFPGYRIATSEEASEYFIRGMIYSRYYDQIREAYENGDLPDYAQEQSTVSGAIAAIARGESGSLQAGRFTYLMIGDDFGQL